MAPENVKHSPNPTNTELSIIPIGATQNPHINNTQPKQTHATAKIILISSMFLLNFSIYIYFQFFVI